jgi:iron complex outermembrane receptor protein
MKKSLRLKALLTLLVGLFLSIGAFAQQIAVKGHVKDTTGEPVIGANVLVKGTTNGTITDFDGNFMLNVPKDAILSVSFVGYKSAEVKAASTVMVTLEDDSQVLDAVVVIGYGSVKKNDMTGSVTAIKPDKLNKGLITNAQDMMTGKIAGVNITQAGGSAGAGAQIIIRGGTSLERDNQPLFVVDGVIYDNSTSAGGNSGFDGLLMFDWD